jgi:hypothetical protein
MRHSRIGEMQSHSGRSNSERLNYPNEKFMPEPRNNGHCTKVRQEDSNQGVGVAGPKGGARAAAGRVAYREEFQRDYGPDLDEPLDGTESGYEF